MEFLKQYIPLGYVRSANKDKYREIADNNDLSPRMVYMLAHGRRPTDRYESEAVRDLVKAGIIRYR